MEAGFQGKATVWDWSPEQACTGMTQERPHSTRASFNCTAVGAGSWRAPLPCAPTPAPMDRDPPCSSGQCPGQGQTPG